MVYGSGVGVFATSHGAQPVGDPCIDDGVAADCQLGGFRDKKVCISAASSSSSLTIHAGIVSVIRFSSGG